MVSVEGEWLFCMCFVFFSKIRYQSVGGTAVTVSVLLSTFKISELSLIKLTK